MRLAESLACYITNEGNLEHEQGEEEETPTRPWIPIFDSTRGESEHATREALRRMLWKQLSERCSSERIAEWRRLRLEKGIPILATQEPPQCMKDMRDITANIDVAMTTALMKNNAVSFYHSQGSGCRNLEPSWTHSKKGLWRL